ATATSSFSPLSLHDALPISYKFAVLAFGELFTAENDNCLSGCVARAFLLHFVQQPCTFNVIFLGNGLHLRLCIRAQFAGFVKSRSEEHTSELQSRENLVCRL